MSHSTSKRPGKTSSKLPVAEDRTEKPSQAAAGLDSDRVYLVDALVYIFRAYHALPSSMTGPQGQPFNAVHGFTSFLAKLIAERQPVRLAVAFDASLTTCFRNRIDPAYKANRPEADPEFKAQIATCLAVCRAAGLLTLASPEYEADDFIATLAAQAQARGEPVTIVSRDKDLMQLLTAGDVLWDGAADTTRGPDAVQAQFGVRPDQMTDFQGMVGDTVDNIPGVPGIGPKAAAAVLDAFGTLDAALDDLDGVAALPVRGAKRLAGLLAEHAQAARLSRQLATLVRDVPLSAAMRGADDDAALSAAAAWDLLQPAAPQSVEPLADKLQVEGLSQRLADRLAAACVGNWRT